MAVLPGYLASVYVTATPSLAFTNEAMTDGGVHTTYTITNQTKRYWDPAQALTVQTSPDGTTWGTVTTGFTVQNVGGVIVFASALTGATPSVRVSGNYMPYSVIADAHMVDIQHSLDIADTTTIGNGQWKTKLATLIGSTIKLSKWWIDAFYLNALTSLMVMSIKTGANSNQRFECFVYMKTDSIKIAEKGVITEDLDFEVHGQVYFIAS